VGRVLGVAVQFLDATILRVKEDRSMVVYNFKVNVVSLCHAVAVIDDGL
jgi:hypothetical protein